MGHFNYLADAPKRLQLPLWGPTLEAYRTRDDQYSVSLLIILAGVSTRYTVRIIVVTGNKTLLTLIAALSPPRLTCRLPTPPPPPLVRRRCLATSTPRRPRHSRPGRRPPAPAPEGRGRGGASASRSESPRPPSLCEGGAPYRPGGHPSSARSVAAPGSLLWPSTSCLTSVYQQSPGAGLFTLIDPRQDGLCSF